jgi:hypothetical protein
MKFANTTKLHRKSGGLRCGLARSAAFGARYPSFSLPVGLYPNHRIPFHQHQESPLQENEALSRHAFRAKTAFHKARYYLSPGTTIGQF